MSQDEFNQLLKRYLEGKTTEQEDQLLSEWYNSPANQVEVDLPNNQKNDIEKRMWRSIRQQIRPAVGTRLVRLAWISGIAACLVLGSLWMYTLSTYQPEPVIATTQKVQTGIEVKNTQQSEQEVVLPDGSVVVLSQNSSLMYDKSFNQARREVYLRGEAFFNVKRDVTKPFVVHAGDLVTEVLGTSFRIRQNEEGKKTEVSVRSGKVSVYAREDNPLRERNGVILTQNQRVLYDAVTRNIVPTLVEDPLPKVPVEQVRAALVFQEVPLEEVLSQLTQLYGIEFVISNPKAKACHITADLNGLSLFTQLELVCKSIDATYEKRGTVVFINGDGC
ncbi:FecR family protein [Telluribacter sp. SYSU D00476]|uniref:FecR family protein n=1 Tax=Telluribacter sp. SYSU D00476 TaxID=2811430 RepID=UPI001FF628BD|nr:FecR family protein [Telluribacter sp. SYSU D00476]